MSTYVQIDKNPDKSVGLDYPVRLGNKGYFKRTSTLIQAARVNIESVLLTRKGERVFQPDFGSGIYDFLFDNISDETIENLKIEVEENISTHLPYVQILELNISQDERNLNQLNCILKFTVVSSPDVYDAVTFSVVSSGE